MNCINFGNMILKVFTSTNKYLGNYYIYLSHQCFLGCMKIHPSEDSIRLVVWGGHVKFWPCTKWLLYNLLIMNEMSPSLSSHTHISSCCALFSLAQLQSDWAHAHLEERVLTVRWLEERKQRSLCATDKKKASNWKVRTADDVREGIWVWCFF